jgi:hypothetical protein
MATVSVSASHRGKTGRDRRPRRTMSAVRPHNFSDVTRDRTGRYLTGKPCALGFGCVAVGGGVRWPAAVHVVVSYQVSGQDIRLDASPRTGKASVTPPVMGALEPSSWLRSSALSDRLLHCPTQPVFLRGFGVGAHGALGRYGISTSWK